MLWTLLVSSACRLAQTKDLKALLELEHECFQSDRLSARSFRYFLNKSQAELWVCGEPLAAYGLVLFHKGTSLARIYSLAVAPSARGQGLGKALMQQLERSAEQRQALFIRLEVANNNQAALKLYQSMGYKPIKKLREYYDDGSDGTRLEKRLRIVKAVPSNLPYYSQTTEFTCGPAALLMAMQKLQPKIQADPISELNLWREATTIFMTTGHGGTSPYGLALAAKRRDFAARLWVSHRSAPFIDGVRNTEKKAVIELIHEDFVQRCEQAKLKIEDFPKELSDIRAALEAGEQIVLLISTYRLNHCKGPHWIWLVHMDDHFAYFNDPDVDQEQMKSPMDAMYVPVPLYDFEKMIKYGVKQYRAALLISKN